MASSRGAIPAEEEKDFLATFKKSLRPCDARWRWLPKFFLTGLMYSYAIPPTDESSCVVFSLRYLLLQSIQLVLNRIVCVLGRSSIAIEIDIALVVLIALYI